MFNKKITFLDYIPDRRYEIIGNCFIDGLYRILDGEYKTHPSYASLSITFFDN